MATGFSLPVNQQQATRNQQRLLPHSAFDKNPAKADKYIAEFCNGSEIQFRQAA
jgi:hypothetical protein